MTRKCSRRSFLEAVGLGAASLAVSGRGRGDEPEPVSPERYGPNVLLIMTDQQTATALSACGNEHLKTPHMDSIAESGVRFAKSYCTAPVCGPARSSLLTGRMPHQTGVNVNGQTIYRSIPNLGDLFRRAGYETAWAGKWHLPRSYPQRDAIPGFEYLRVKKSVNYAFGASTDDPAADEAIRFLRRKHDRPFLLGVSLHNPHDICYWFSQMKGSYFSEQLFHQPEVDRCPPLPSNFAIAPDEPQFLQECRRRTYYGQQVSYTEDWDNDRWRRYLYAYYRLTEQVDRTIGRVLAALREEGLEDDTVILFTSDHGDGVGAHKWVAKLMLYEEPVTVPMILSYKGFVPAGRVDKTHLVSAVDVLPTLCDYAGIACPQKVLGGSLRKVIERRDLAGRKFVVTQLQPFPKEPHRRGRMLRSSHYKYVAFSEGENPEMLFDLQADPGETKNLARDPDAKDQLETHRALLANWIQYAKDKFEVPG